MVTAEHAVGAVWEAAQQVTVGSPTESPGQTVVPDGARSWLAALRLLSGVAFQHLAPDTRLLPPESARFFYVNRAWTDALIEGALSVAAITDADRAVLQQIYPAVRDDLDQAERFVRVTGSDQEEAGAADVLTGMLLRSNAVKGWPGLHVRGYRDPNTPDAAQDDPSRLGIMRMEQLAPSVLLVIWDGVPAIVHVDEPRHGIQYGVDENSSSQPGQWSYQLTLRKNAATSGDLTENGSVLNVPFRANAPGVIDMTNLQAQVAAANLSPSASMFALQMIRLPYRQVFGPLTAAMPSFDQLFRPTVAMSSIRLWPGYSPRPPSGSPS
jgi:hypothetical protein